MGFKRLLAVVTIANQLTFLRLVAVPFFTLAVLSARFDIALALFVAAAITDILDGLTARMLQQQTRLGRFLDPTADKLLLVSAFVLLTDYPAMFRDIPMMARLPIWLSILAISRDILIVAVAVMMYLAYGRTRFDPTIWGKLTTVSEALTIGLFLLANAVGIANPVLDVAVWVTLALILISGFDYLFRTGAAVRREGPDRSPPGPGG